MKIILQHCFTKEIKIFETNTDNEVKACISAAKQLYELDTVNMNADDIRFWNRIA